METRVDTKPKAGKTQDFRMGQSEETAETTLLRGQALPAVTRAKLQSSFTCAQDSGVGVQGGGRIQTWVLPAPKPVLPATEN